MDLEKLVKFIEGFGRDYVLTILSLLWNPYSTYVDGKPADGTADASLDISNGRTFSYAVISVGLGTILYSSAMGQDTKLSEISIPLLLLTFLLWFLLAGFMHVIVKLFGSELAYVDTISVCLRIMPLAYVLAALFVFAISVFTTQYSLGGDRTFALGTAFIIIQLSILAIYFPAGMRRVHLTSVWSQVVMTIAVVAFVGTVNSFIFNTSGRTSMRSPPMSPAPMIRPPMMPQS